MKFDNSTESSRAPVGKLGLEPPESCSLSGTDSVPKTQQESTDHWLPVPFSLPTCPLMFLAAPKEPVCLQDWEGSGGTSWGVPIYGQILEWGLRPFLCVYHCLSREMVHPTRGRDCVCFPVFPALSLGPFLLHEHSVNSK